MSLRSTSYRPRQARGPKRHLTKTEVNFRPIRYTSHLVPLIGSIVLVMTLHGQQQNLL